MYIQDDSLHKVMEDCVLTGKTVVVLDVDPAHLLDDHIMLQVLEADYPLMQARKAQVKTTANCQ